MSKTNKVIWVLGLMCAFLLILVTGQTNIRNFQKIQASIEEIYKDRLVVKGLVFNLLTSLHQKEIALISSDKSFFKGKNSSINSRIREDIRLFRETKLTRYENSTLDRFSQGVEDLIEREEKLLLSEKDNFFRIGSEPLREQVAELKENLKTLSEIQLSEGKKKLVTSTAAVESMNTFAIAENYILITFAILMLAVIFVVPGPGKEA